jgi:flagellar motor switch protein FliG
MAGEPSTEILPALSAGAPDRLPARLTGARKAAVLMAALGSERAASLIQLLGEEEIESLSREMARLNSVGAETTASIFTELTAGAGAGGGGGGSVSGGLEFAHEVIERALGAERAADILGRLSSGESRPFEFLRRIPPERIAALLRGESPQTVALILASLHANLAAGVLSRLPETEQPDVALRIARMGEASTPVIRKVEELIRHKLGEDAEEEYATAGGARALAGILNHADRSLERNVLDNLAGTDKELADEVRGMLFVFEDIVKLDERAVQQVLREVDQKDLVLALRGAPENVMEVMLGNMSERGAEMLKEEMEIQPPQRKRDIDAAQSRVVATVRNLEEAGTIVIATGGDGDGEEAEDVV